MFGRGTWAIFGLGKDSLETFKTMMEDKAIMVAVSQMAASAITRYSSVDTIGINPFGGPRLDEEFPVGSESRAGTRRICHVGDGGAGELSCRGDPGLRGIWGGEAQFRLHSRMPWYGMWAVSNEWKDVSDVASIKEQRSYSCSSGRINFFRPMTRSPLTRIPLALPQRSGNRFRCSWILTMAGSTSRTRTRS